MAVPVNNEKSCESIMPVKRLLALNVGDTVIEYLLDENRVALALYPAALENSFALRRTTLSDRPEIAALPVEWADPPPCRVQSLLQISLVGDESADGFSQGHTMLNGRAAMELKYEGQQVKIENGETRVLTTLRSERGFRCVHAISFREGDGAVRASAEFHNESPGPLGLAMFGSFHLGHITPFASDDAPERLLAHRFRSAWSAEGRLETRSIEELHLERSWNGHGVRCERFGQVGTAPAEGFFPFVAIEDQRAGVIWGAQLAWAGSWQMEIYRKDDFVAIAGGLADREFGHWMKTVPPGGSFRSPTANLACVAGTLEDLTDRLTRLQISAAEAQPQIEHDLPIVFNEWCTTWGNPSHEKLVALAECLRGSPVRYLVIDAGWYERPPEAATGTASWHGDWIPSSTQFPEGLEATAAVIRECGLIPGLWLEMENVGRNSTAFRLTGHLLKRDGVSFTVADRRFWDLTDPFVVDYLSERVTGLLERCSIGYLKVDYNETLGLGVDHPDSLGEGLREQVDGIYRLFERIRKSLPDLVIENCASGGHRLEPSMMALSAMGSFSDAHELREIPIIAANLHHLILPRQSQVWAVLRAGDDRKRLVYSLAATFLGRMCLSGDIAALSAEQWACSLEAQELYRSVWPVIKNGKSRRFGPTQSSWRHPQGWQGILRVADSGREALAIIHSFESPPAEPVRMELPPGQWSIGKRLSSLSAKPRITGGGALEQPLDEAFTGTVLHLHCRE